MYYLSLTAKLPTLPMSVFLLYTQDKKSSGERPIQKVPYNLQNPQVPCTKSPFIPAVTLMALSPSADLQSVAATAAPALRFLQQHQGSMISGQHLCQALFCICKIQASLDDDAIKADLPSQA